LRNLKGFLPNVVRGVLQEMLIGQKGARHCAGASKLDETNDGVPHPVDREHERIAGNESTPRVALNLSHAGPAW
jgi:hypothetical protein